MIRAVLASALLVVVVVGCSSNGDVAETTSAPTGIDVAETAEPSTTPPIYDETTRVPLAELPGKVAETIAGQGGDRDANQCVIDEVLAGFDAGDLAPEDLDAYVRLGTVTDPMQTFLQQLQISGVCAPS